MSVYANSPASYQLTLWPSPATYQLTLRPPTSWLPGLLPAGSPATYQLTPWPPTYSWHAANALITLPVPRQRPARAAWKLARRTRKLDGAAWKLVGALAGRLHWAGTRGLTRAATATARSADDPAASSAADAGCTSTAIATRSGVDPAASTAVDARCTSTAACCRERGLQCRQACSSKCMHVCV